MSEFIKGWSINKSIPITIIITIIMASISFSYWGSQLDARVGQLDNKVEECNLEIKDLKAWQQEEMNDTARLRERLVVVEVNLSHIRSKIDKIDGKIDKVIENTNKR